MSIAILQRLKRKSANFAQFGRFPIVLDRPCLSFTIDDFPINAWQNGHGILADHDVKATFYVSGGFCEGTVLGLPQYDLKTLDAVCDAGHEIGNHTFDHFNACQVSTRKFMDSVDRNAAFFAQRIPGVEIRSFAFPYGDMTAATKYAISKRFTSARGTLHGVNVGVVEASDLRCICLQLGNLSHYDLEATLAEAAAKKAWVVVLTHDISADPTPYGCRPDQLRQLLTLADRNGYDIVPVGDVLARNGSA